VKLNKSKYRIKAAIVAFNRCKSLIKLINSIYEQSFPVDEIIVIDNSTSNDVYNAIKKRLKEITYIRMKSNTGSAGGFSKAVELAVDTCDFVWLFDDDVLVRPNALQVLVKWLSILEKNEKIGAIKGWYDKGKNYSPQPIEEFAWRGTLINTSAIKKIGLPESKFFLYGEDVDYSLRIKSAGFKMYLISESKILVEGKETKMKLNLLGRKLILHSSPFRLYYSVRNEIIVYIKHHMFIRLIKIFAHSFKVIIFILFAQIAYKQKFIKAVLLGLYHGVIGQMGKNSNISNTFTV
jgi:GT2 family glycosyltransferase